MNSEKLAAVVTKALISCQVVLPFSKIKAGGCKHRANVIPADVSICVLVVISVQQAAKMTIQFRKRRFEYFQCIL